MCIRDRIATGDYDAVIIGHSQFEKIPVSAERQERILTAQIDEIENAIAELKSQNGERFSIKQIDVYKSQYHGSGRTPCKGLLGGKSQADQ